MPRKAENWEIDTPQPINYEVVSRLTGKKRNALEADVTRGYLSKSNLEDFLVYLARYARRDLKMRMLRFALDTEEHMERPAQHGIKKVTPKKTAKKKG